MREIIGMRGITRIRGAPRFVEGVINLRGKVIPVIELRLKFGMETVEQTNETCIIVVQAGGMEMGIVVDRVSEVTDIGAGEIQDAPSFGTAVDTDYILGIGKSAGRVRLLLDIDQVLSPAEAGTVQSLAEL